MEAWLPPFKKEKPSLPSLPLDHASVSCYLKWARKYVLECEDGDLKKLVPLSQVCHAFALGTSNLPGFRAFWWEADASRGDAVACDRFLRSQGLCDPSLCIEGMGDQTVTRLGLDGDFVFAAMVINALDHDLFVDVGVYGLPEPLVNYFDLNPLRKRQVLRLSLMLSGLTGIIAKKGNGYAAHEHRTLLRSLAHQQGGHAKHVFFFGGTAALRESLAEPEGSPATLYAADPTVAGRAAVVVKKSPRNHL